MGNVRFFGLALSLFAAVFFVTKWFFAGQPQGIDPDGPRITQLTRSSEADNDATRDKLRHELLDSANALNDDPCNAALKKRYIEAVNNYARAWLSIVPCFATQTCRQADSKRLDLVQQVFGTPLDGRVRDAMQEVHAKHIFKLGDFPNDTSFLVGAMARDGAIDSRVGHSYEIVSAQLGHTPPKSVCGG